MAEIKKAKAQEKLMKKQMAAIKRLSAKQGLTMIQTVEPVSAAKGKKTGANKASTARRGASAAKGGKKGAKGKKIEPEDEYEDSFIDDDEYSV